MVKTLNALERFILTLSLVGALASPVFGGGGDSEKKKAKPKPVIEQTCPDNWYVNRVGDKFIFNYTSDIKDEQTKINELQNYATRYSVTPLQITNRKVDGKCVTGTLEGSLKQPIIPPDTVKPIIKPFTPIPGMQWDYPTSLAGGVGKLVERDTTQVNKHDITYGIVDGKATLYDGRDVKVTGSLESCLGTDEEQDKSAIALNTNLMVHRVFPYAQLKAGAEYTQGFDGEGSLYPIAGLTVGNERIRAFIDGGPGFDITEGKGVVDYKIKSGVKITTVPVTIEASGEKGKADLFVRDYVNKGNLDLTFNGKDNSFGVGASIIAPYEDSDLLNSTGRETVKRTWLEGRVGARVKNWFAEAFVRGKNYGEYGKDYTRSGAQGGFKVGYKWNKL